MQQQSMQDLVGAVDAAVYSTVNDYVDPVTKQRGATALAPKVGMKPGTLSNKANPLQDAQLGLCESVPIQLAAGNFEILYAYAQQLGHCAYALPRAENVDDLELLDTYCELHQKVGLLAANLRSALRDRRVTRDELPPILQSFDQLVRAGLGVIARMEALAR